MIVDNICRQCGHHYDGHWHNLPKGVPSYMKVPCPRCGEQDDINSWNDESDEQPNDETWDEEDL